ncbi:MAG TPA: ABC transporter substrate-binding protein [Geminicoccus sp.]|uniref:ABC transporter substrate-binding protein n=1 Tax=Geminicoccus sp. TaxID=2024832 RepID=UPI002E30E01D|nr:ABC transporter substrate-binding protein [Geminicoccus sp.]HEX2528791.1 ABC transporter substrate-binding protein [Geminicoccus sp.]
MQMVVLALLLMPASIAPAAGAEVTIGYLHGPRAQEPLSLVEVPAENDGREGAELAIEDNNTTGRFLNQSFSMVTAMVDEDGDAGAQALALAEQGASFVVADLAADALVKAADAGRERGLLFFNIGAADDRLREEDCRPNVIHVAPSHSMLADGLAQYLVWKQWRRWLLVEGSHPEDRLFGDALRRAAKRFGAEIVEERIFEDKGGARQTDSGVVQVQRQIPVLTQEAPEYDVLVAADESEVFAAYLPYRTWDPRPVAGSAGLVPTSWHASHGQWGALQMHSRFQKRFSRFMTALDMQAWSAVRIVGEAATRTGSTEPSAITAFIKGPELGMGAYKGQKLTIRDWNLQVRQPILLTDGRMVVSVSPQEGFLHQVSELDTLGVDRPETRCSLP